MKKLFLMLVAVIVFVICANAQNNVNFVGCHKSGGWDQRLELFSDGSWTMRCASQGMFAGNYTLSGKNNSDLSAIIKLYDNNGNLTFQGRITYRNTSWSQASSVNLSGSRFDTCR